MESLMPQCHHCLAVSEKYMPHVDIRVLYASDTWWYYGRLCKGCRRHLQGLWRHSHEAMLLTIAGRQMSISEISTETGIVKSSLSSLIYRLLGKRMITMTISTRGDRSNRRINRYYLSDLGKKTVRKLYLNILKLSGVEA